MLKTLRRGEEVEMSSCCAQCINQSISLHGSKCPLAGRPSFQVQHRPAAHPAVVPRRAQAASTAATPASERAGVSDKRQGRNVVHRARHALAWPGPVTQSEGGALPAALKVPGALEPSILCCTHARQTASKSHIAQEPGQSRHARTRACRTYAFSTPTLCSSASSPWMASSK